MTNNEINQPAEGTNSEAIETETTETTEGADVGSEQAKETKGKSNIKKLLAKRNAAIAEAESAKAEVEKIKSILGVDDLSEFDDEGTDPSDKVDALIEQKLRQKEVQKSIKHYTDQLPEEDVDKFNELFNDFSEWKSLDEKNVSKFIRAAANELYADSENKAAIEAAKQMAAGFGGGGGASQKTAAQKQVEKSVNWSRSFLQESGVLPKKKD